MTREVIDNPEPSEGQIFLELARQYREEVALPGEPMDVDLLWLQTSQVSGNEAMERIRRQNIIDHE